MPTYVDTSDFQRLAAQAARFSPELAKQMRNELRAAARLATRAVQREIKAWPTHGVKHTGLRSKVAAGVTSTVQASTRDYKLYIRQTGRALDAKQQRLPRHIDKGAWRHPVYGNRKVWVAQRGHPYYVSTIRKEWPRVLEHASQALNKAARSVT